jgi:hypothetical protein
MSDMWMRDVWAQELLQHCAEGMQLPVRCLRCHGGVYDLAEVTVTARYTDCSMWKTPCCGAEVDDRGETGWKLTKDYERLDGGSDA